MTRFMGKHTSIISALQARAICPPAIARIIEEKNKLNQALSHSVSPLAASLLESQEKISSLLSRQMSSLVKEMLMPRERATKKMVELISQQLSINAVNQAELRRLYESQAAFNSKITASQREAFESTSRFCSSVAVPELASSSLFNEFVERYFALVEESDPEPFETLTNEVMQESEGKDHSEAFQVYIFPLLLFFLSLLITDYQSGLTEAQFNGRFDKLEEQGKRMSDKLEVITNSETFYYVKKTVHMRDGASTKHHVLLTIYPGTTVRLLSRSSKWIEVEYYDYRSDATTTGWVYKKYLKMIGK